MIIMALYLVTLKYYYGNVNYYTHILCAKVTSGVANNILFKHYEMLDNSYYIKLASLFFFYPLSIFLDEIFSIIIVFSFIALILSSITISLFD